MISEQVFKNSDCLKSTHFVVCLFIFLDQSLQEPGEKGLLDAIQCYSANVFQTLVAVQEITTGVQ